MRHNNMVLSCLTQTSDRHLIHWLQRKELDVSHLLFKSARLRVFTECGMKVIS